MTAMKRQNFLVFVAVCMLLPFSISASGKESAKPSTEVLASITTRGVLLAGYDYAAWHASDAVEARAGKKDPPGHYIARKTASGWVVDFGRLDENSRKFLVSYEAVQSDSPEHFVVKAFEPAREDTGWNLAAAKGIEAALREFHGADRPYNVAVLPGEGGEFFVYVYLAQVKDGIYPYGADARYRFSADGGTILAKRQLHKSVIEVPPASPSEGQTAGGYHVHILSSLPEDTDVLLVLQRTPKVPEFVGAGGLVYKVDVTGKIAIVDRLK